MCPLSTISFSSKAISQGKKGIITPMNVFYMSLFNHCKWCVTDVSAFMGEIAQMKINLGGGGNWGFTWHKGH